jgi:hypothetical protein
VPSGEDEPAPDVEALQHQVDELKHENEELKQADGAPKKDKGPRWRRILSWVLVVLACLLAVVSVMVVFARNQLLNTDAYVSTVAPLASNPAIQTQVATRVSEELVARTDLSKRVKSALPAKAGFLVAPITDEVQNVTYSVTLKLVQSQKFEQLWVAANRASHKQLVNVLTGTQRGAVSTKNGRITIDLGQVELKAKQALDAKGITVFDKVPAVKGLNYVLFQSNSLVRIQRLVKFLNKLAVVLPIITLLFFAGAIVLARNRRRGLVRSAAGLALSMALILILIAVGRNQYIAGIKPPQSPAAQSAVLDIVTANLRNAVRIILIVAALVAVAGLVAGNAWIRAKVGAMRKPGWVTGGPVHDFVAAHRKALQWSVLALGLLILVIWGNPTALVAVVVVLVTLVVVALVGLFAGRGPRPAAAAPADAAGAIPKGGGGSGAGS